LIKLALDVKNRPMLRNLPCLFLLLFLIFFQNACYAQVAKQPKYVPGEVMVKFKANVSPTEAKSLHTRLGSKLLKHFEGINADLVRIKEGWTVEKAIEVYQAEPYVKYAEPNYTRRIQTKK
jgi:thermitase